MPIVKNNKKDKKVEIRLKPEKTKKQKVQNNINMSKYKHIDDELRIEQIKIGIENHIREDLIDLYADNCFEWYQMEQIRLLLEFTQNKKYYELIIDEKLNYLQMCEIRLGVINGLSPSQIRLYKNNKLLSRSMSYIRKMLENNIDENIVIDLINPNIDVDFLKNRSDLLILQHGHKK